MSKIAQSRVSWIALTLAASFLPAAPSTACAQTPDELLAAASDRPLPRGAAKPDGPHFSTSAGQYADVKCDVRVPRAVAKHDDRVPFAEAEIPDWLRLSSAAEEVGLLRHVPEVGLPALRTTAELDALFKGIVARRGPDNHAKALIVAGNAQIEGLPFRDPHAGTMVDAKRNASLNWTSATIRTILDAAPAAPPANQPAVARAANAGGSLALSPFFRDFHWYKVEDFRAADQRSVRFEDLDIAAEDTVASAVLPGLMQVLAVQPPAYRLELVRQLRTESSGDDVAIAALVRLALFDSENEVRRAAVQALQRERPDKVGRMLLEAYRYPWHIIAERATEALVELDRVDLLPALVDLLDAPDPSVPFERTAEDRKEMAVREVVKLNHNRNCLVCHAPTAAASGRSRDPVGLQVRVPAPDEALPPISSRAYYNAGVTGFPAIRANLVYLRQDFSRMERVENHGPWPEMQRYDYVVRTRTLTAEEAKARRRLKEEPELQASNHRAVLVALARLTAMYVGEDSGAWRPAVARFLEAQRKSGR